MNSVEFGNEALFEDLIQLFGVLRTINFELCRVVKRLPWRWHSGILKLLALSSKCVSSLLFFLLYDCTFDIETALQAALFEVVELFFYVIPLDL